MAEKLPSRDDRPEHTGTGIDATKQDATLRSRSRPDRQHGDALLDGSGSRHGDDASADEPDVREP
jgi:hypothetical protein